MHKLTMKCDRVGNSNICVPCAKMGRPCSWTCPPLLFGIDDWHGEIYKARTDKGDLHKAFVKGLMCWPKTEEALEVHDIGSDSGVVMLGDETTQHAPVALNQLTASEQATFDRWDTQIRTAIDAVLQLRLGTTEYSAAMEVVSTLAENVNTDGRLSPTLRSYMKRIVERDVYYFMINGRASPSEVGTRIDARGMVGLADASGEAREVHSSEVYPGLDFGWTSTPHSIFYASIYLNH